MYLNPALRHGEITCCQMCFGLDWILEVFFSGEPNCILKSYVKVLGSLQKFKEAAEEFKGVLGP